MPILIDKYQMIYLDVPKAASTSMKFLVAKLVDVDVEDAKDLAQAEGIIHRKLSKHFVSVDDAVCNYPDHWKFAVVRDPADRLLSSYRDWVVARTVLQRMRRRNKLKAFVSGLTLTPTAEQFFRNLNGYRQLASAIKWHTQPYRTHIGNDPTLINAIYRSERLDDLISELETRTNQPLQVQRRNVTARSGGKPEVSGKVKDAIVDHTKADYALLGNLYPEPFSAQLEGASA